MNIDEGRATSAVQSQRPDDKSAGQQPNPPAADDDDNYSLDYDEDGEADGQTKDN